MTDMQTSLPLLIVWTSILNLVVHFSTQHLTGEMKCPTNIPLPYAFHFISSIVDAAHAPTISQMIWSTSYHHMTLLVHQSWPTCFSPLPLSISAKFCSSFTATRSIAPKPPTCPSCLQLFYQAKSCIDLLHLSHMTQCHVSYAMSSFITCVSLVTNPSHFYLYGMCCSHKCSCGLKTCVFHLNI
jgi:hypothetical protein